jgi:acetyl-CoA carboxylase / biotin carboxylase 1
VRVSAVREKHKDNMALVTSLIFSHTQVAKKNILVTMLIDHLWANEPGLTDELASTLSELTSLNRSEHSRVALRARQVNESFFFKKYKSKNFLFPPKIKIYSEFI